MLPSAMVIKNQMSKYIHEGCAADEIKHRVSCKEIYKNISAHEKQALFAVIDTLLSEHLNYAQIQEVMQSQVLLFHDSGGAATFDPVTKSKKDVNLAILRAFMSPKVLQDRFVPCYQGYDPRTNTEFYSKDGRLFFNLYTPPAWLRDNYYFGTPLPVVTELPVIYKTFFTHLTNGDSESFDYLIKWVANSLRNKNNHALATFGKEGIGKGTLGDIIKLLHGESNSGITTGSRLGSQFNGVIDRKTFVYIDEVYIKTQEQENNFKTLINHEVEVEQKGKDARKITNFANLYISSNEFDSIKLTSSARRYSFINLTDKKMSEVPEYENDLIEKITQLTDPNNIQQLAYYLIGLNINPSNMVKHLESKQMFRIRQAGFTDWESYFIHEYAPQKAGQELILRDVCTDIEADTNAKHKLNTKQFDKLLDKLIPFTKNQPGKWVFRVNRDKRIKDKGRPYLFYFAPDEERAEIPIDLASEE